MNGQAEQVMEHLTTAQNVAAVKWHRVQSVKSTIRWR